MGAQETFDLEMDVTAPISVRCCALVGDTDKSRAPDAESAGSGRGGRSPCYDANGITLFHCDCMELMRETPDKAFDIAIVDPPYGIGNFIPQTGKRTAGNFGAVAWNDAGPSEEYFSELRRVSAVQIIWGANYYNSFTAGGAIVWDKKQTNPKLSRCEIASVSNGKRVAMVEIPWAGFIGTRLRAGNHPCEKPVSLYSWILVNYAQPGQRILDTHLGSGSIAIAAREHGCSLVASEIDESYIRFAVERIARDARQGLML